LEYVEGIILKKLDYKESSAIVYLYTDKGLVSVLVHGSRKLKSPYLNVARILNVVGFHVSGKNLLTARDADVIEGYREIKKDLEKFMYIQHISELVYHVSTHQHDHKKLYQFLRKVFDKVETEKDYIPYLNMVELKLLYLLGLNPLLSHCTGCKQTSKLKFSVSEGGMCCETHYPHGEKEVTNQCVNALKTLYYFDLNENQTLHIDPIVLKELRDVIDRYYEYHLNFRSHSRKMLLGLIGY